MINERELELVRAFVYDEKYICLPKKEIITGNSWSLWRTLKEGSE